MEPLSKITISALNEITKDQFAKLSKPEITVLLGDFQYAWLRRLDIQFNLKMLDVGRRMCYGEDKAIFRATQCNSVDDVRNAFSAYIKKWHKDDDRVILGLSFDGTKIDAQWVGRAEYLKSKARKLAAEHAPSAKTI